MTHKNIILFLLSLSMFLVVLDSAIVNVALPSIKNSLHLDVSSLEWILTAYILTFGGFLMLGGRTSDLYGRRKVLTLGIAGFSFFSLLTGLSGSGLMLIILRALQGLAGAFMSPTALSILLATFKEGPQRNKALSIWSIVAAGGAAAGVFLGGLLTQYLGWRWCFFVNVPIGIATIIGIMKYMPAHIQESENKTLDIKGAFLITSSLMALVYGLSITVKLGWTASPVLASFAFSLALLILFIYNEKSVTHPLVPFSIFQIRNVVGGNLIMLPIVAGAIGTFFFLSFYIQNILHYSPVLSGLSFLPLPLIIGSFSYNAPRLLKKFNLKTLVITGICLTTIGTFLNSTLNLHSSYWSHLLPTFIILASGFGLSFVAITVAATSGVPLHESGLASGLINTSQQIGSALGLAVLEVVATSVTKLNLASGQTTASANMHGYQQAFFTAGIFMIISLIITITIIRTPKIP